MICYVAWYSAAKFTFPIKQPSNKAAKCQGHQVSLWRWPLTCNLEKCYSLRSSFGMYDLERRLRYWHLLTRQCPCNLLPEPTSPKHEYRGKLWGHPMTSSMTSSPWKEMFLGIIWDVFFISEVKLKLCLIFKFFQNGRHFELATNFLPDVIPEVEYARKMVISISDILGFWSTL